MNNIDKQRLSNVKFQTQGTTLTITFYARLESTCISTTWPAARQAIENEAVTHVVIDATQVDYCDGAGIAMLFNLQQYTHNRSISLVGLKPQFTTLLAQFNTADYQPRTQPKASSVYEEVGKATYHLIQDGQRQIAFIGQLSIALLNTCFHLKRVRWRDIGLIVERIGFNAVPIVCLIAFILGVILAFQAASSMQQFGAEIYVADLVGLSLLRELSPLLTTILLAGRSGAAFAAEIGTMKVNEEVNALITMGLEPIEFLAVPRIIAATLTTPLLIVIADAVGIFGGAVVMTSFNIPMRTFAIEMFNFLHLSDFLVGIGKGCVFGFIIAAIGCMRGLDTQNGATAVGQSTTSAVVTIIVLVVVLDGLFAIFFTQLGI